MSSGGIFDLDVKEASVKKLENELAQPGFWQDAKKANEKIAELKALKAVYEPWRNAKKECEDIKELLGILDSDDDKSIKHLREEINDLRSKLDDLEFKSLLGGPQDKNNAILSINAGAGGTESCDWVSMLLRMYAKWAGSKKYSIQQVDFLPGEEAGIKNVTAIIKGPYAYGYLKSESGVHRLVRISPFDSNRRRHTSFASVDVIAEISDEIKVDINKSDLKIDTYRAGGRGGQHVNVTDSAVRITHLASNIVVQCQNERSQHKNKSMAMKVLKSRLYEIEKSKQDKKKQEMHQTQKDIAWGSQIRSYVFNPYQMVKDHRTDVGVGNVDRVMDGDLDIFIDAYLKIRPEAEA